MASGPMIEPVRLIATVPTDSPVTSRIVIRPPTIVFRGCPESHDSPSRTGSSMSSVEPAASRMARATMPSRNGSDSSSPSRVAGRMSSGQCHR